MRKIIPFAFAAALALSGCGTSGEVTDGSASGSNRPTDSAAGEEAVASEAAPAAPENPTFGETYTFENGVALTISAPQPFTPSEYAYVGEPAPASFVVFDVTVVNGSAENYDPSMFMASMQSANVEQEQVFDSENGIDGSPSTTVLAGREAAFKLVFGATDPNDLVLEVSPGFEYESAIFTS